MCTTVLSSYVSWHLVRCYVSLIYHINSSKSVLGSSYTRQINSVDFYVHTGATVFYMMIMFWELFLASGRNLRKQNHGKKWRKLYGEISTVTWAPISHLCHLALGYIHSSLFLLTPFNIYLYVDMAHILSICMATMITNLYF